MLLNIKNNKHLIIITNILITIFLVVFLNYFFKREVVNVSGIIFNYPKEEIDFA
jgi:hypothetical protein